MALHALDTLEQVGSWYRFDRYVVGGGYVRPADDAKLETYDPWEDYREARRTGRPAPYDALLRLSELLPTNTLGPFEDAPGDHGRQFRGLAHEHQRMALEGWCAEHGLLGVLPMRVLSVCLAARIEEPSAWPAAYANWLPRRVAPVYVRGVAGWGQAWIDDPAERGRVLFDPNNFRDHTGADAIRIEPLTTTWADYFPSVPTEQLRSFRYPRPLSLDFWRIYAEPLWEFLGAAQTFRRALAALVEPNPAKVTRKVLVARGSALLERLAGGVRLGLGYDEKYRYRPQIIAPSLLASYAAMVLLDVGRTGGVFRCANPRCHAVRPRASVRSRFCEKKCEGTVAQARRRDRQRIALARALREGLSGISKATAETTARSVLRTHGSISAVFTAINKGDARALGALRQNLGTVSRRQLVAVLKPLASAARRHQDARHSVPS